MDQSMNISEEEVRKLIGENLKIYRNKLGLTRNTLGKYLGITGQGFERYESGVNRISFYNLMRLADLFDIDLLAFIDDTLIKEMQATKDLLNSPKNK